MIACCQWVSGVCPVASRTVSVGITKVSSEPVRWKRIPVRVPLVSRYSRGVASHSRGMHSCSNSSSSSGMTRMFSFLRR